MHPNNSFDNYEKKLITFSIEKASQIYIRLMGILWIALVVPFIIVYIDTFIYYFTNFNWLTFLSDSFLFIMSIFFGIILHEAIHGLT